MLNQYLQSNTIGNLMNSRVMVIRSRDLRAAIHIIK